MAFGGSVHENAHARMPAALREVERRAELDNPHLGTGLLREPRRRLEPRGPAPPAGEGPAQHLNRVQLLRASGRFEPRRGAAAQAIGDLRLARERARGLPPQAARRASRELLGLAGPQSTRARCAISEGAEEWTGVPGTEAR